MPNTNYPVTPPSETPRKDSKNLIIVLLAIGILATWGYFLWDKNNAEKEIAQLQKDYLTVDSARNKLDFDYRSALDRLDSIQGVNNDLEGKLTQQSGDIQKLRGRIDGLMRKQRLSESEKKEAETLIKQLNEKINGLEAEVARLTAENQQLSSDLNTEKQKTNQLSNDLQSTNSVKQDLEKQVEVASTLNASNISITPYSEGRNGKEKVTDKAKRVDKLVIAFDVENRITTKSTTTDIYVCITSPDGTPVSVEALGSGKFDTKEDGERIYTTKKSIDFEPGKKNHVDVPWKQNSPFKTGNYKIEVYHNGYKIGEGVRELRKGLF
jgi:outer membrane murein-binding lipoprotein Lpp